MRIPAAVVTLSLLLGPGAPVGTANDVTILRDEWGVPHVYGPTDPAVVFGAAYAQAEDNWPQVAENVLRAVGRGAELLGEEAVADDYLARALEIPRRSVAEYERAPRRMRALYDAYAAGMNRWLTDHPEARPVGSHGRHLLERVEPWHTLALIRFKYHHNEYLSYAGLDQVEIERWLERARVGAGEEAGEEPLRGSAEADGGPRSADGPEGSPGRAALAFAHERSPSGEILTGSNEWAVSGSRTASGYPMLLVNPHVPFFGLSQYTEIHLHSQEGLRFSGLTRFGFMLPYMGNSDVLGWAYTDNYGDYNDLYWLTPSADGRAYRYGEGWRELRTWVDTLLVRGERGGSADAGGPAGRGRSAEDAGGPAAAVFRFAASHHGPVVGVDEGGRPLAARLSKLDEGGWFEQWYAMMRSRSHAEWLAAVARLNVPYMNTMYADTAGNIHYIYTHAVPRRSTAYDWSEPVDGSDPEAEWNGYHDLAELPQVLNPASGWLQNTNSDPLRAAPEAGLRREDYPPYMIGNESHNARAVSSVRVLEGLDHVTLDEFADAVLDTRLSAADEQMPALLEELRALPRTDAARAARLEGPSRALEGWDRRASVGSVATTLFVRWADAMGARPDQTSGRPSASGEASPRASALEEVVRDLEREWGTWEVAWGEVNRLQRPDAAGRAPFSDGLPSLPVAGAPGWLGSVFTFHTRTPPGGRRGYGVHGNSFVKVIEFTPVPRARSLWVFGQSADPASPHYFDQAELYSERRLKRAWFTREEIERHAEPTARLRHPGP